MINNGHMYADGSTGTTPSLKELQIRIENLEKVVYSKKTTKTVYRDDRGTDIRSDVDLTVPLRPFVKRYARGLTGPRKFVLLLAHLSGGDPKVSVSSEEVMRQWSKMTAKNLLGVKFNPAYPSRARVDDWVDTKKNGFYHLRPSWKEILS